MKEESLADLGFIKLYLEGYLRDNKSTNNITKYNDYTLTRCIELVGEIVTREITKGNKL